MFAFRRLRLKSADLHILKNPKYGALLTEESQRCFRLGKNANTKWIDNQKNRLSRGGNDSSGVQNEFQFRQTRGEISGQITPSDK